MDVPERARSGLIRYRVLRGDSVARPFVMYSTARRGLPDLPALVDSGADGSALPLEVARRLNVSFDQARVRIGSGAGGAFTEYEADGDVVIASEIGPITLTRPSINGALPFVLLGRRDFFEGRRVCFDQRELRMEIETR